MKDWMPMFIILAFTMFIGYIGFSTVTFFEKQEARLTLVEAAVVAVEQRLDVPTILILEVDPDEGFILKRKAEAKDGNN